MSRHDAAALALGFVLAGAGAGAAVATPPSGGKFPLPEEMPAVPDTTAALAIRAVPGTPGGPPIAGVPVHVDLMRGDVAVRTVDAVLDEHGVAVIDDLGVDLTPGPVTPRASVEYAGVTYARTGPPLDLAHPHQTLEVTCYEVTTDEPAWVVAARHVLVDGADGNAQVAEIIVIENPTDRTWFGTPGADGRGITLRLALPPGAMEVELGPGFHGWCCTSLDDRVLANSQPLMPGRTEMRFAYSVRGREGGAALDVLCPADTGQVMVVVPERLAPAPEPPLTVMGSSVVDGTPVRYFAATDVPKGDVVRVSLAALGGAVADPADTDGAAGFAQTAVLVGGGLLLLILLVVIFTRTPGRAAAAGEGASG